MIYGYIKNVPNDTPPPTPSSGGWSRPSWWLEQPTIGDENVVWELMTVFAGSQNPYTHNLQASGGVTTEFYADKDDLTPFYTATANDNTLIDFDDCNPIAGQFVRQCWVKSFPTNPANDWGAVDFTTPHTVYGYYSSQIVERLISCKTTHPAVTSNQRMGTGVSISNMLENIEYRNRMPFMGISYGYNICYKLKRIYSDETVVITGNSREAFSECGLMDSPINITFAPSNTYQMFAYSNESNIVLDFANSTTQYMEFYQCKANTIIGLNMGSCTQTVGALTMNTLYYLELHGYTLAHSLNGNAMRGVEVFTAWVDSLGSANGSQNITISTLQYNSFGGLGSYVDDEIYNKGYTLIVV